MFNINQMMKQAQNAQKKWAEEQEKFFLTEYEGISGGGLVKVMIYGNGKVKEVTFDKSMNDLELLGDLFAAAYNDAKSKMDDNFNGMQSNLMSGFNLPAGFKIPG